VAGIFHPPLEGVYMVPQCLRVPNLSTQAAKDVLRMSLSFL